MKNNVEQWSEINLSRLQSTIIENNQLLWILFNISSRIDSIEFRILSFIVIHFDGRFSSFWWTRDGWVRALCVLHTTYNTVRYGQSPKSSSQDRCIPYSDMKGGQYNSLEANKRFSQLDAISLICAHLFRFQILLFKWFQKYSHWYLLNGRKSAHTSYTISNAKIVGKDSITLPLFPIQKSFSFHCSNNNNDNKKRNEIEEKQTGKYNKALFFGLHCREQCRWNDGKTGYHLNDYIGTHTHIWIEFRFWNFEC